MTTLTRSRLTGWPLRVVASVHLLAVLGQPVFAGLYLTGDVDAISVHAAVGGGLAAIGILLVVVAALHVLVGRGRWWLLAVAVALLAAVITQISLGYARALAGHVPLGVAIVTGSVLLGIAVWRPAR